MKVTEFHRAKQLGQRPVITKKQRSKAMMKFLLWLLLLAVCRPLALLALVLYPIVWIVLLPFRLIVMTLDVILLPVRPLRRRANAR